MRGWLYNFSSRHARTASREFSRQAQLIQRRMGRNEYLFCLLLEVCSFVSREEGERRAALARFIGTKGCAGLCRRARHKRNARFCSDAHERRKVWNFWADKEPDVTMTSRINESESYTRMTVLLFHFLPLSPFVSVGRMRTRRCTYCRNFRCESNKGFLHFNHHMPLFLMRNSKYGLRF